MGCPVAGGSHCRCRCRSALEARLILSHAHHAPHRRSVLIVRITFVHGRITITVTGGVAPRSLFVRRQQCRIRQRLQIAQQRVDLTSARQRRRTRGESGQWCTAARLCLLLQSRVFVHLLQQRIHLIRRIGCGRQSSQAHARLGPLRRRCKGGGCCWLCSSRHVLALQSLKSSQQIGLIRRRQGRSLQALQSRLQLLVAWRRHGEMNGRVFVHEIGESLLQSSILIVIAGWDERRGHGGRMGGRRGTAAAATGREGEGEGAVRRSWLCMHRFGERHHRTHIRCEGRRRRRKARSSLPALQQCRCSALRSWTSPIAAMSSPRDESVTPPLSVRPWLYGCRCLPPLVARMWCVCVCLYSMSYRFPFPLADLLLSRCVLIEGGRGASNSFLCFLVRLRIALHRLASPRHRRSRRTIRLLPSHQITQLSITHTQRTTAPTHPTNQRTHLTLHSPWPSA